MKTDQVIVCGGFDDIRSGELRFLQEAAKLGEVSVLLWSDEVFREVFGAPPKFPFAERFYFLSAVRYVALVLPCPDATGSIEFAKVPSQHLYRQIWADVENPFAAVREKICREQNLSYHVFKSSELSGFPELPTNPSPSQEKGVVVTGSFDWFHSGHVRFLEEASAHGSLFVVVGHDANIRLLKGEGHPLLSQEERRYTVASIKFVKDALISTGDGWLDADPEIKTIKPDIYVVNEEGDRGGKREYCSKNGIEYLVLKRNPAPGLPKRSSTALRGF